MAKVLVVDDDPNLLALLSEFLKSIGHEVVTAPDPLSAIARAKTVKPDIIIMDVQMPAGGAAAAQRGLDASPELKNLPVLFCTGMPLPEAKKLFPETPLRRFASKPLHLAALKDKLEMLLLEGRRPG